MPLVASGRNLNTTMDFKKESALALALLKHELKKTDDEDQLVFECGPFIFSQNDEDVMSHPRIGHPPEPTGKKMWIVEIGVQSGGSYWEPPDYDVVQTGSPQPSLWDAIKEASRVGHENDIGNICESVAETFLLMEEKQAEEYFNNPENRKP